MTRNVTIQIESVPDGQVGPILASLGGLQCAPDQPFSVYRPTKSLTNKPNHRIVVGDTETIQYYGDSFSQPSGAEGAAQYLVGVVENNTLRLIPTPVVHLVPRYKLIPATEPKIVETTTYLEARNQLGSAFGSKKMKSSMKARERGHINTDALDRSAADIQGSVAQSTELIATSSEQNEMNSKLDDPLPPHDLETTDVSKVYPLAGLFPVRVQSQLNSIISNTTDISLLYSNLGVDVEALSANDARPLWLEREMIDIVTQIKDTQDKGRGGGGGKLLKRLQKRLALCSWTLYLVRMQSCREKHLNCASTFAGIVKCPVAIVSDILSGYTDKVQANAIRFKKSLTARAKARLLCTILGCYLHLQLFSVIDTILAHDLGITVPQVQKTLRLMGCTGKALTAAERAELNLVGSSYSQFKLSAPLKLPVERKRKRAN